MDSEIERLRSELNEAKEKLKQLSEDNLSNATKAYKFFHELAETKAKRAQHVMEQRDQWCKCAEELAVNPPAVDVSGDASFVFKACGSDWSMWMERRNKALAHYNELKGKQ